MRWLRRDASRERGFTLIEVLVAFAIAAVVLVPLLRIFSGGMGALARAERAATAALWAQSVLAARDVEAPLAEGVEDGDLPGGFHWRRVVQRYSDAAMTQQADAGLIAYAVTLTVAWPERGGMRDFTVQTLQLARPKRGPG